MKRALTLAALALSLCACGLPPERSSVTVQDLTVQVSNPGPGALTGDPTREGDGPVLQVRGTDLTPAGDAARWCTSPAAGRWSCVLPQIPQASTLTVRFTGGVGARISSADFAAYSPARGSLPVLRFWPPLLP